MTFAEYQAKASTFATYKSPFYPYLGLSEEVGELLGIFAKALRGDAVQQDDERVKKEMGDVLWMLQEIANLNGYSLEEIAEMNIRKLESRKARGVIQGEGDNR